ncbi:hemerythrin domain-containing protein [Rhodococcus tukisamuensis]|uniref:Hemerythrin HHE cation binding domain-containing protein n=1 Tax=Rhodococcus tukisamuensis TaxID=168276 RepID=A0A1G6PGU3_9NOCA|nr:hemerythrin domain-containing protein [Rhodococcus tukisamuensis]SDC78764.1 Hemerythrin HHE cation binding domain-containing protein [Rhodococcus tukisamuensis]
MTTTQSTEMMSDTDIEIMGILHDAFRRDAARLARAAQRYGSEDPAAHAALLVGWHGFSHELQHHHTVEDTYVWPLMRSKLAGHPDAVAVLDAMEAEHALIDPALAEVESAFDDPDHGHERLADRVDDLVGILHAHLAHEEREAVPMIRATITAREWRGVSKNALHDMTYREKADGVPYLLEEAPEARVRIMLDVLPPPLRFMYRHRWNPRYRRVRRWE